MSLFILPLSYVILSPAVRAGPILSEFSQAPATNRFSFNFKLIETTHLGTFDRLLAPPTTTGGGGGNSTGGGGGNSTQFDIFDFTVLPADSYWQYAFRPGVEASLNYDTNIFNWPNGGLTQISLIGMFDETNVSLYAPSGIGILIDPTVFTVKTSFYGVGFKIMVPMMEQEFSQFSFTLHGGGGLFAFHSRTEIDVQSAFLDVQQTEVRNRIAPLLAVDISLQSLPKASNIDPTISPNIIIGIQAFKTDNFWTFSGSVGYKLDF